MYGFYPVAHTPYATRRARALTFAVPFSGANATLVATLGILNSAGVTFGGNTFLTTTGNVQLGFSIAFGGTAALSLSIGSVIYGDVDFIAYTTFSARPQFLLDLFAQNPTSRIEYVALIDVYRRKEARLPVAAANTIATTTFTTAARAATVKREYAATIEVYRRKEARKAVAAASTIAPTSFATLAQSGNPKREYTVTLNLYGKRLP